MSSRNGFPAGGITTARTSAAPESVVLDRSELRGVLGRFATGVTVVGAGQAQPRGMTANAFTSVSLQPPLILVCVKRDAAIHQAILDESAFSVSVLAAHQEVVARYFADHSRPRGSGEFDVVSWQPAPHTGVPMMTEALAWLECRLANVYDGADHSIFIGEVLAMGRGAATAALLFFGGDFHYLGLASPTPDQ